MSSVDVAHCPTLWTVSEWFSPTAGIIVWLVSESVFRGTQLLDSALGFLQGKAGAWHSQLAVLGRGFNQRGCLPRLQKHTRMRLVQAA